MADFYTDHNVAIEVAPRLRFLGHTAGTAHDLHLENAEDDEHLLVAAQHGWTLVTHNRKDFILLHNAWRRWTGAWQVPAQHGGILIVPQVWPAHQTASAIDSFVRMGASLKNQLYVWRQNSGWVRR